MALSRRLFFRNASLVFLGNLLMPAACSSFSKPVKKNNQTKKMTLTFEPYELQLKHAFTLATSSRTTTPVMITKLEYDGYTGCR
jgi:hypothetical protein